MVVSDEVREFKCTIPAHMVPTQPFEKTIGEFGAVAVILWASKMLPADRVAYLFDEQAKVLEELAKSMRSDKVQASGHAAELYEKSQVPDLLTHELRAALRALSPGVEKLVDAIFALTRGPRSESEGEIMRRAVEADRACVELVMSIDGGAS